METKKEVLNSTTVSREDEKTIVIETPVKITINKEKVIIENCEGGENLETVEHTGEKVEEVVE